MAYGSSEGRIEDTSEVEIVPAPPPGRQRTVSMIDLINVDGKSIAVRLRRLDFSREARHTNQEYLAIVKDDYIDLLVDERAELTGVVRILSEEQSIVSDLESEPSADGIEYHCTWIDEVV